MIQNRESMNIAGAFVAIGLVCILGFITWALVFQAIPDGNENSLTLLIGVLSANVGLVVGFFFGSSVTNKKQTDAIEAMAKTAQTAGSALSDPGAIVLKEGQSATATATPAGTVIEPQTNGDP